MTLSPREHLEAAERLLREWEHRRRGLDAREAAAARLSVDTRSEWQRLHGLLDAADLHIRLADRHHLYCPKTKKEGES